MRIFKKLVTALIAAAFICSLTTTTYAQTWLWAKNASASSPAISGMATDGAGNVYITGIFSFSAVFGNTTLSAPGGGIDFYLAKYNPQGNVLWAKQAGNGANVSWVSLAADKNGNVYVTGEFNSNTMILGTDTLSISGFNSIFLAKYNTNGQVQWAKRYGGPYDDGPYYNAGSAITVDRYGDVYVCGEIQSSNLVIGATTLHNPSGVGIYFAKLDPNGNWLWAQSPGSGTGTNVTTDRAGNLYLSGLFGDTLTIGNTRLTANDSGSNMFLAKFDSGGHAIWATSAITQLHAFSPEEDVVDISSAVDIYDNVYVVGSFQGRQITFGTTTLINTGDSGTTDVFIAKYDSTGHSLWAKNAGTRQYDYGFSIATDKFGNAYYTGMFASPNSGGGGSVTGSISFPPYTVPTPAGSTDPMYIVSYDPNGNVLCATALASGGGGNSYVTSDRFGDIFIAGNYAGDSLKLDTLTLHNTHYGCSFISKFQCAPYTPSSIYDINPALDFKLYPNPTTGYCTLQISGDAGLFTATLLDITGREVISLFNNQSASTFNFSTQSLAPGVYLVHIIDQQGNYRISKLIKE